ncbi:sigma-70 family RNA polymerase sigma factor [Nocardioides sp. SOB44]|uniref:Sigma-70 family RNA polymerase sigma factor n=1 Tax=Nocardioides cremeus TaxID=3058044 RepID=A0ABT8TUC1_9ACTN|nr:sigma-70 family RNA polymerase sigma factor [Nocardioides cremeus]MDO3396959.1 sigma-70 family RNA polymerase sigma factor [Nocardioides cremeus]
MTSTLAERRSTFRASDAERAAATTSLLARAAATDDDAERRAYHDEVVRVNMRVAEAVARRYARRGIPVEDLTQVAYLALVRAVRRFDAAHARDLLAYAVPTIEGDIRRHFRDHGWTIRPPRDVQRAHTRLVRTGASLDRYDTPTLEGLATQVEESVEVVREALSARTCFSLLSLDQPISSGSSGGAGEGEGPTPDVADDADRSQEQAEARLLVRPLVASLADRDQQILRWRFVDELSQREIAQRLGLSQIQVSRLLQRVLTQMRGALAEAV